MCLISAWQAIKLHQMVNALEPGIWMSNVSDIAALIRAQIAQITTRMLSAPAHPWNWSFDCPALHCLRALACTVSWGGLHCSDYLSNMHFLMTAVMLDALFISNLNYIEHSVVIWATSTCDDNCYARCMTSGPDKLQGIQWLSKHFALPEEGGLSCSAP